jgi:PAS domain S-box-containing protein
MPEIMSRAADREQGPMRERIRKILFVGDPDASCSFMAAALASAKGWPALDIHWAGAESDAVHAAARQALAESGLQAPGFEGVSLANLKLSDLDLVVSLSRTVAERCAALPGNPQQLHWEVAGAATEGAFRENLDRLRVLVGQLYEDGYLEALLRAQGQSELLLDHIVEGVIAHDFQRRVFAFNRAAERITGYRREAVLNQDCHKALCGGLCGGKCSFCDDAPPPPEGAIREVDITTAQGERRRIELQVNYMIDARGRSVGVLACFRDITRETRLARRLGEIEQFAGIIGRDPKMLALYDLIPELAESAVPVLIQGESGTGKELIAAALHNEGPRAGKLFVPVNCGALPEGLLESELFGHVRGAFTGAIRDKKGRFELADGGTIFLDEIGDISPAMQVKLLRVLQEGTFERVGSEKTMKVNVRVISATHRDLAREMAAGKFREDLFYRLSVVPLLAPPLRERRTDIPLLANHFLARLSADAGRPGLSFSPEAIEFMVSYHWPGNVRELQNWIQFALIKCRSGAIKPEHLPPVALQGMSGTSAGQPAEPGVPGRGRQRLTPERVQEAIAKAGQNKVTAARLLGVSRATLYRFIESSGLASA